MELLVHQDPAPLQRRTGVEEGQRGALGGGLAGVAGRKGVCRCRSWADGACAQGPALPRALQWPWASPGHGCMG